MSKGDSKPEGNRALRDAVHEFMRTFGMLSLERTPCGHPLHVSDAHALLELHARGERAAGDPTLRELGERLQIDKSNVSRLCTRLEKSNFITCYPCENDKRAKRIQLTASGRKLGAAIDVSGRKKFSRIIEKMDVNSSVLIDGLTALAKAMASMAEDEEDC